jgi:hypothetical protein
LRPYDWTPTAARSATTNPNLVARPGRSAAQLSDVTVATAVEDFLEAAEAGRAVNRSGRSYRPSALRDVRGILDYHVVPALGDVLLRDVRRQHVQALVDRLGVEQLSESRIRSVVSALRALYGYAIEQGQVEFNPADGLVMPRGDEPGGSGLDELWDDPPAWEERPPRAPWHFAPTGPGPRETSAPPERGAGPARDREAGPARERDAGAPRQRERVAYEPIALVPERILSFAMRAVFVLFALVALVTVLESL